MVHGTLGLNSLKLLIKVTYPTNADNAPCNLFSSPYVVVQPQKMILIGIICSVIKSSLVSHSISAFNVIQLRICHNIHQGKF